MGTSVISYTKDYSNDLLIKLYNFNFSHSWNDLYYSNLKTRIQ